MNLIGDMAMFHSIEECTNFIFKLKASTYKGEPLEAVRKILFELGSPEKKVKFIHFAGSNGKGSTLNATRAILMGHGLKVGAFISPHLERVNERLTINENQISDANFLRYANKVVHTIEEVLNGQYPSFFEIMTVISFLYFAEENVDVALMETGIGGRIDSTNVITPEVSVITTISLEHTEILGDTIEKIAAEKAGIIKRNKPVVVGVEQIEAKAVIKKIANVQNAPSYFIGEDIHCLQKGYHSVQHFNYSFQNQQFQMVPLGMKGAHQVKNASLAITACLLFDSSICEETVRHALQGACWKGRFEQLGKQIIIDGAHNSEGTEALIKTLKEVYPEKKYKFIYAALQDKDHEKSIHMMDEVAQSMGFTEIPLPRAAKATTLSDQSNHSMIRVNENWQQLISEEKQRLKEDELLVITGSLYFIAEVRQYLLEKDDTSYDTEA